MKKNSLYILFALVLLMGGCKSGKNQEANFEKKERAPSTLVNVSRNIHEILSNAEELEKLIDGTYIEEKSLSEEKEEKGHGSHGNKTESSQGSSHGDSQQNQGENQNQQEEEKEKTLEEKKKEEEEKRQEKITKSWQQMSEKIKNVHKDWNSYEVEEKKGSLSLEKIDLFRASINNLTKAIEDKDIMKVYEYGSQSLLNISPMFDLYKDDLGGDINRIMHGVYFAYLRFIEDKASEGIEVLSQLESHINNMKLKIGKDEDKIKIVDKVSASIDEMENAMGSNSLKLIRIKKDIVVENLLELE